MSTRNKYFLLQLAAPLMKLLVTLFCSVDIKYINFINVKTCYYIFRIIFILLCFGNKTISIFFL